MLCNAPYLRVPSLQEHESGNTALHTTAFGGCIEMALQLVCMGASVGLPNKDGFTPLDSMQPSGHESRSLQGPLVAKSPHFTTS